MRVIKCHNNDYYCQNQTGNDLFFTVMYSSFDFLLDFLIRIQLSFRKQILADKHHVSDRYNCQRNTYPGKFEKGEWLITKRSQSTGNDNVRRCTY